MAPLPSMLALCFILSATLASPVANTGKSEYFDSNFDNEGSNAVLPELSPVGVYNKLFYNAFSVVPRSNTGIDEGVVAHSPPNLIASGIPERLTNGTAFITSLYSGTPVESFDLSGFYFGCTPDAVTGEATLADGCVVTVTGYKAGTNTIVGPVDFDFFPKTEGLKVPMIFAELPSTFTRLNNVTLVPTAATTTGATQEIGVDNVQNTVHYF